MAVDVDCRKVDRRMTVQQLYTFLYVPLYRVHNLNYTDVAEIVNRETVSGETTVFTFFVIWRTVKTSVSACTSLQPTSACAQQEITTEI